MANLTLTIPDDVLRRARIKALERGTSVNALVRDYLRSVAGVSSAEAAVREALAIGERAAASSGPGGRRWTRDELHER